MDKGPSMGAALVRWSRVAATAVLLVAVLDWIGWATGVEALTRVYPSWPQMPPWSGLWLGMLAAAFLVQSGRPSSFRVWIARGMTIVVGIAAVAVLVEYVTAQSFGLDQLWFSEAVRAMYTTWPGRPSPQAAASTVCLAAASALTRTDRRWAGMVWPVGVLGAGLVGGVSLVAYLFGATALVYLVPSHGISISTALAVLLLVVATSMARPDRPPLGWLLSRPDRGALVRLYGVAIGFPVLVALLRLAFLALGQSEKAAFALSVTATTVVAATVGFRLRRQEQDVLIEKELLARERADA